MPPTDTTIATALLLVTALLARLLGARLRSRGEVTWSCCLGWVISLLGTWTATAAWGAFSPVGYALLLAAAATVLDRVWRPARLAQIMDLLLVLALGTRSLPPLEGLDTLIAALVIAAAGLGLDRAAGRLPARLLPRKLHPLVALAVLVCAGALVFAKLDALHAPARLHLQSPQDLCVGLVYPAERLELSTGAVAWLNRPGGKGPHPGILLFHGANSAASMQPSSCMLRRAMVHAGFVVLAVDHPGYGQSPSPSVAADVDAWDPLPTDRAALQLLRSQPDVDGVYIAGQSVGAVDVLRLLSRDDDLRGAILLGASLLALDKRPAYWLSRFHTDRGLRDRLSMEKFRAIHDLHYDRGLFAGQLKQDHAPVLFIRFENEFPDIRASRDTLYDSLPGAKERWDWPKTSHYANSHKLRGITVGHSGTLRKCLGRVREFVEKHTTP